jgi:hypothetical protein
MTRFLPALGLGFVLIACPASAAPGDPFGGDDQGCVPSTTLGLSCAKKLLTTFEKLRLGVVKCHLTQEGHAFQAQHSSPGFDNAEENCELGPSNTSANNKFDARMAKLAAIGCDATAIANVNAARDVLLGDQSVPASLDSLNGAFFCDTTTGAFIADTSGSDQDEAGYIPADDGQQKCAVAALKSFAKLYAYISKCHIKAAGNIFKSVSFDEEACEAVYKAKFDAAVAKYVGAGICAPCLGSLVANFDDLVELDADSSLDDVYVCPGP